MQLNKAFFFGIVLFLTSIAQAEKIAAGVFKSDSGVGEMLTTIDKPCDPALGNATLITSGKQVMACWVAEGDKIKVNWLDGSTSKLFDAANMVPLGDITTTPIKPATSAAPTPVASVPRKTHLTCEADGWTVELDVERNSTGELQRFLVDGDAVMTTEKPTLINFSYDGVSFALNTVTAGFTYEPAGMQNYIRRKLLGNGKAKGTGTCRINELVKKF